MNACNHAPLPLPLEMGHLFNLLLCLDNDKRGSSANRAINDGSLVNVEKANQMVEIFQNPFK